MYMCMCVCVSGSCVDENALMSEVRGDWADWLINWTELDDDITEFYNEMPLSETWAFNLIILH